MPLYIRDDEVDALAEELKIVTGAASKTEAVKTALRDAVRRKRDEIPLIDRVKAIQEQVAAIGPRDPSFNFRKFREELWGDED